jgi:hypothetical protein
MFGPFENTERMVSKLSIPELTQLAKNPTGSDPNVQFAAVSEIQRRNAAKAPPNGPGGPQPTVIDQMAMEAMTPASRPGPVPGDPIASGVAAMMQQQQAGGPPQGMVKGGRVRGTAGSIINNMQGISAQLAPSYDTTAMTPEEVQALMGQFYGDGDYLNEDSQFKDDEVAARRDRNTNLWLALAQAGFGMASTGSLGQGALMGLEQARGALNNYREDRSGIRDRRSRNRQARGAREDRMAGQGLEALLNDRNRAEQAQQSLLSASSGIASAGAQIDSANARDDNGGLNLSAIADALYEENKDQTVQDRNERGGFRIRQYSRADARRDATLMMATGRSRGRGSVPDDASELTRIATSLADPMMDQSNPAYGELVRLYNATAARARSNGMNAPDWGSAQGNAAPAEGAFNRNNVRGLDSYQGGRFVPEPNTPYTYDAQGNRVSGQ